MIFPLDQAHSSKEKTDHIMLPIGRKQRVVYSLKSCVVARYVLWNDDTNDANADLSRKQLRFSVDILNFADSYLPVFQPGGTGFVLGSNMLAVLSLGIYGLKRIKICNSKFEWTT